ncbi:tyrosine-type recombinase/integrase [Alkaliphilus pronyensis]|uniref:Tyrosine-type recombinase/integrase n=1 Tax=Alkaliphilus pronyensis TaxID=1482732 RepID=A0A6I0FBL6_9FIRM|nr:tyrosine-type recombinase/integrase [Alkaliphilus pronyensis]KAB3529721.1 tyrosine-type recombinase/integrase [Alkaliphilus pronyensis]
MKNREIDYIFTGPLAEYCTKYIVYKRSLGFKMGSSVYYLLRGMDTFFLQHGLSLNSSILTKEMVEKYVARRGVESVKTQHMRMSIIRQFSLFMNRLGFSYYVYPETDFVQIKNDFIPYIFTHNEIERLTKILDKIPISPRYPTYHIIYPMLFRMLYGCGLRINEALGLKLKNIDIEQGIIRLDATKNNIQRLMPMSKSLHKYCKKYVKRMGFSSSYDGYYYPSKNGSQYNSTPVYCQFRKFMSMAGIFRENGTTPRVHDIRHTFSVHALEKMVDEGNDIYCSLPILSTYLGHRGLESTEKYLRLTIEAHASIIGTMTEYYNDAYSEVVDYEN